MKLIRIVPSASAILAGLASLLAFPTLAPRVPVHFGFDGMPDRFGSRWEGVLVSPLVLATIAIVALLVRKGRPWVAPALAIVSAMLLGLHLVVIRAMQTGGPLQSTAHFAVLGVSWIALALVLPRVRRNRWIGVRVPWTLASDEVWSRTHRFASKTFGLGGLMALLTPWFGTGFGSACIIASALAPAVHAFFIRERRVAG